MCVWCACVCVGGVKGRAAGSNTDVCVYVFVFVCSCVHMCVRVCV